ncbi:unnamed protein product [Fusarium fujikuroi]|nr:unnamed protein product [Fusarium fujikuroi]VZH99423.1 unnamed protein product [Fusarium fujikuroi]
MPDAERPALDKNKLVNQVEFPQAPIEVPAEDRNRRVKTYPTISYHWRSCLPPQTCCSERSRIVQITYSLGDGTVLAGTLLIAKISKKLPE